MNLFQSKEWQILQEELGENCFLEEKTDYHFLAINKSTPVGNYLYLPYGPDAKSDSEFNKIIKAVTRLAKEKQSTFIRIEPQNPKFTKLL